MYFTKENVRDKLLKNLLSDEDVAESTDYITNLASRLDVKPGDDSYEKKRVAFAERVKYWEREITRETFNGFCGASKGQFMPLEIRLETLTC